MSMEIRGKRVAPKIRVVPCIFGVLCCILSVFFAIDNAMESCLGALFLAAILFLAASRPAKKRIVINHPPEQHSEPSKKTSVSSSSERISIWEENAGCPFSFEIPDSRYGIPISYKYTDVFANICGDVSHLKPGSVVYTMDDGVLQDVSSAHIATIENSKIKAMISDYRLRGDVITARVLAVDEKLHVNIGFYRDLYSQDEETEEDDTDFGDSDK